MRAYQHAHSLIITTIRTIPQIEFSYGKAKFQVYPLKAKDVYSVAVFVGNTAIYASCDAENDANMNRIAIPGIIFATGIVDVTLSRIFTSKKDKYR